MNKIDKILQDTRNALNDFEEIFIEDEDVRYDEINDLFVLIHDAIDDMEEYLQICRCPSCGSVIKKDICMNPDGEFVCTKCKREYKLTEVS